MKILNVTITILISIIILPANTFTGFAGRAAEQSQEAYQASIDKGLTITQPSAPSSNSGGCCGTGQECQPVASNSSYIPSFYVSILDQNQQPINGQYGYNLLPTSSNNTSFTQQNTILTVNIFAPSNTASNPPTFIDQNYIVFYTLKTPDGQNIYADMQTFKSTSIPHFIAIQGSTSASGNSTSPAPAIFEQSTTGSSYQYLGSILPTTGFPAGQAAWQIVNGVSPMSQSFLLQMNNASAGSGTITISKISGTYDAGMFAANGPTPPTFTPSSKGGNGLGTLGISFNDNSSTQINFASTQLTFTPVDLASGLILNVVVTSSTTNNFNVVATLRTTDGTKMRKETLLASSSSAVSSLPTSITISQIPAGSQTANTILTTDFLSSQISTGNMTNMLLPLNLKFSISQQSGQSMKVLMV